ncbi:M48 family metalloprotease [Actinoplanes sp. NPDC051494]|uniref:M48 family metalloprotease n=1 Tax=Actinoplanes sp. NPDC051494 TaxID=3363907 RepID=UPI0037B1FBA8
MSVEPRVPAAVRSRFVLLVGTVLASTVFTGQWISRLLPGQDRRGSEIRTGCSRAATEAAGAADPAGWATTFARCSAGLERDRALVVTGGVVLLILVTAVLGWLRPWLRNRRDRLAALREDDDPELTAALRDLVTLSGLPRGPVFMTGSYGTATGALAYGRPPDHRMLIGADVITRCYTDRAAFRAVVLRELGHLRNRDVLVTYASVALWQSFLIVALVPFGVSLWWTAPGDLAGGVWRMVVLTVLVHLTMRSVLRLCELHADARAREWDGPGGALGRLVAQAGTARHRPEWLDTRPSPRRRAAVVGDPRLVHDQPRWVPAAVAFGAGLVMAVAQAGATGLMLLLTPGIAPLAPRRLGLVLVAGLVVATVGADLGSRVRHGRPPAVLVTGTALTAGLIAGSVVASTAGSQSLTTTFLLVAAGVLWTGWVALDAGLRTTAGPGPAVAAVALGVGVACWLLIDELRPVLSAARTLTAGDPGAAGLLTDPVTVLLAGRPEVLVAAVLLVLRLLPLRILAPLTAGTACCAVAAVLVRTGILTDGRDLAPGGELVPGGALLPGGVLVLAGSVVAGGLAAVRLRTGAVAGGFAAGLGTGGVGALMVLGDAVSALALTGAVAGLLGSALVRAGTLLWRVSAASRHRAAASPGQAAVTASVMLGVLAAGLIMPAGPGVRPAVTPRAGIGSACVRFRSLNATLGTIPAGESYARLVELDRVAAGTGAADLAAGVADLRRSLTDGDPGRWNAAVLRLDATCAAAGY